MNKVVILGQVRHALTVAGTIAVTLGVTDSAHVGAIINDAMLYIGVVTAVGAFLWSFDNAIRNHQLKQWAENLPFKKIDG
jgi:hypothetical protein